MKKIVSILLSLSLNTIVLCCLLYIFAHIEWEENENKPTKESVGLIQSKK